MIPAAALLFLVGLAISERLFDDFLLLLDATGLLTCPRRRLVALGARLLCAFSCASVLAIAGLSSLRACLLGHGHTPGACPDLVGVPHLCFDALGLLGSWRWAPLWAFLAGAAILLIAVSRRFLDSPQAGPVELRQFAPGESPVTIVRDPSPGSTCRVEGLVSPRIVVPADFEARFPPPERHAALLHELGHIRGRDPWIFQAALLYKNLFFLLPGPRRFLSALHATLEERADDWAVRTGASPSALARSIVLAAGVAVPRPHLALAGDRVQLLFRRIERLRGRQLPPARLPWSSVGRIAASALLLATGWLQLHCLVEALI